MSPTEENGDRVTGIIPAPATLEVHADATTFRLTEATRLVARGPGASEVAETLGRVLRAATGFRLPVVAGAGDADAAASDIALLVRGGPRLQTEAEGYALECGTRGVRIEAAEAAGLFWGTQTLQQLLPAEIRRAAPGAPPPGGWTAPAVSVADAPRFAYRGAMLDVARHFFPVDDVLDFIDRIALLKLNVLHLHLTDDQGWRIEIDSWPELTGIGAATSVGGDGAGFYSKDDYRRIVAHAAERFVTIVPEIDLPGHTNAALSAYPELNPDGLAPAPYDGVAVGFSTLSASPERAEATDRFLADVTREVAELTHGPWLHLGGDEPLSTPHEDYLDLVRRMTRAAAATGKTIIGWHELGASTELPAGTIGQYWGRVEADPEAAALARSFVEQGGSIILSPADAAYLDMTYPGEPVGPTGRPLGLDWAGTTSLEAAYGWEPAAIVPGLREDDLLGIEAPLWTETIATVPELEFMVFPRLAAIAEIAWSPAAAPRDFLDFAERLATLGTHLDVLGIAYHRIAGVPWVAVGGHAATPARAIAASAAAR